MIESAGNDFAFAEINCCGILQHGLAPAVRPDDIACGTSKCPARFRLNQDRVGSEGGDASEGAGVGYCAVIHQGEVGKWGW